MFICAKHPVLSNAPLCALPKILQVNKPPQATESSIWRSPRSQSIIFILHIYNPSCAMLIDRLHVPLRWKYRLFFFLHIVCALPHSYIHTFIHPVMFSRAQYHRNKLKWVVLWLNEWLFICPSCGVFEVEQKPLSFCSVREETGQQTPNLSAHSCRAGVTQGQKCLASSRGENMPLWCNKIPEYYISAIQANP